jgi:uncharacterized membrane protein
VGRLLIIYLLFRQATAAVGLISIAGHPQTVRPLVAPMALAAGEQQHGPLDEAETERIKALAAATDNVGVFFGEDIFIAIARSSSSSRRWRPTATISPRSSSPSGRSRPPSPPL